MNENLMFFEIKELCKCCAEAIDHIAKDCNINQNLVAKMFIATMDKIVNDAEEKEKRE